MIPQWLLAENAKRSTAYRRDDADERFLYRLNDLLARHANDLDGPCDASRDPHPVVFIIGVPRAGKTMLSQLLSFCLDVGYMDNLIARFWRAPVVGIRLSRMLRPRTPEGATFESDYGKTRGPFGPHDFSYFWHHWLRMDTMPYDARAAAAEIDWPGLARELASITRAFDRTTVFKSPNPGYHVTGIANAYPRSLFLHLVRDPIDSAVSLMRGRRDNFGSLDEWYGQWPIEHAHLLGLPWHEQIGGQLRALTDMFAAQFSALPDDRVMRIDYRDVCRTPGAVLDTIATRIHDAFGDDVARRAVPPASFPVSRHGDDVEEYDRLVDGLDRFGLPARFES